MQQPIVHAPFERMAALYPDRTALRYGNDGISYSELNERAVQLAGTLAGLGLPKGTVVAVLLPPGPELVVSLLAILKVGYVYMPTDTAFGRKRLQSAFRQCNCATVITSAALREKWVETAGQAEIVIETLVVMGNEVVEVWERWNGGYREVGVAPAELNHVPDPEDGIYVICTSGTTGESKAILGSHRALSHFIQWEIAEFEVDAEWRISQLTSITFDASLRDIFTALSAGATLCIPAEEVRVNPAALICWLEDQAITLVHCVPSLFKLLTNELAQSHKDGGKRLPRLRNILMAGEPLYAKDITAWRDAGGDHVQLVALYGTSETTLCKTFHRVGEIPATPAQAIHVGKPIPEAHILIVNNNELCRIGEIGEVYIRTPHLSKGYYNNPELTSTVFVQNPLTDKPDLVHKTGDIGKYLPDRSIEILGRLDDQVKVNGIRLELKEIEQAMLGFDAVREAVVVANKSRDGQYELIGYYVGAEVREDELNAFLEAQLPRNTMPSCLMRMEHFPLTINGKVDKKALPKPSPLTDAGKDYEAPVGEMEKGIALIWEEVLGIGKIGRNISFFEIGGNSLKSLLIISKIFKTYGVLVKLDVIFTRRTIAGIAAHLTEARRQEFKGIPLQEKRDYYEVSHSQSRAWIQHQTQNEKALYNVAGAYLFEGQLDVAVFRRSVISLVERHEILRTNFLLVEGELRQRINACNPELYTVEQIDLSGQDDRDRQCEMLVSEISHYGFDLENGPLFKAALIRLDEEKTVLALTIHHIASDAWSVEILTRELFTLYNAFKGGKDNPLPPLHVQYKDYAAWHNRLLKSEEGAGYKAFWSDQFKYKPVLLELPLSYPRPATITYEAGITSITLPQSVKQEMEKLSLSCDATLFMTFMALLNIVLYRHSGQTDITIGSPVAGREHPDLENQVGFYVNTLPIRVRTAPQLSFREFLMETKATVVELLKHQQYPFDKIMNDLEMTFERNRNPLFDVGFTYIKENELSKEEDRSGLEGLEVSYFNNGFDLAKTDLWFKVLDFSDTYALDVAYNKRLFTPAYAGRLLADIETLVAAVTADPGRTIKDLASLLTARQQTQDKERMAAQRHKNIESLRRMTATH